MNILFQIILGIGIAVVITALLSNPIGIFIGLIGFIIYLFGKFFSHISNIR